MGVSKNSGTPKSSILIGFSILNHPFWGTPIFGNIHIYSYDIYTWIPNGAPCFDWNLGLVLEGPRPSKIEVKFGFQVVTITIYYKSRYGCCILNQSNKIHGER